jgi:hypothetical protein
LEASRPPIRLIGATIEEAQAHALAASLAGAGFSQIDVEIV